MVNESGYESWHHNKVSIKKKDWIFYRPKKLNQLTCKAYTLNSYLYNALLFTPILNHFNHLIITECTKWFTFKTLFAFYKTTW